MTALPADPLPWLLHRPPILCVDVVVHADDDGAACEHLVRAGPHLCDGVFWEGGLIEGLAQTAGVFEGMRQRRQPALGLLVGVRDFQVLRRPAPGERVRFAVTTEKRLGPVSLLHGVASVGGDTVAAGVLKFFLAEPA